MRVSLLNSLRGFSLVELLIVLIVIGVLSAAGAGYYSSATLEARVQGFSDELEGFFSACRKRAALRGIPVELAVRNNVIFLSGSPLLSMNIGPLNPKSVDQLDGLKMTPDSTVDKSGKMVGAVALRAVFPGNREVVFNLTLLKESAKVGYVFGSGGF